MSGGPQAAMLADGRRLHLQHGPIDLVIEAFGSPAEVERAYRVALRRFETVLTELTDELTLLRAPASARSPAAMGAVARRMQAAVAPFAEAIFITPMAAVAGAVADEILAAMTGAADLTRAYVNNGGDIALHLAPGETFSVGLAGRPDQARLFGQLTLAAGLDVRGLATSGWRGRSFSLGIADAVTTMAESAAAADAAATVVANAVDLPGHAAVTRRPARDIRHDSDLGDRLVTTAVAPLAADEIALALSRGEAVAAGLASVRLIAGAALHLAGATRLVDLPAAIQELPCPPSSSASAPSSSKRSFTRVAPPAPFRCGAALSLP